MKSITIANEVVELTLFCESETIGEVYKGKRHDADITIICPIDSAARVEVSSTDLGEIGYLMVQQKGFALREYSQGVYSFVFKL
jgi:hypothetical protein